MLKKVVLFYLMLLPINPALSSVRIGGYPVITLLVLIIYAMSVAFSLMNLQKKPLISLFLLTSVCSFMICSLQGGDFFKSLINISIYSIPLVSYNLVSSTRITIDEFVNAMCWSMGIAAVLTLLVLAGFLTKRSGFYVNIYYVDTSAGIIGLVLSVYSLFDSKLKQNTFKKVLFLLSSLIVVFFSQSRGRILIALSILMGEILLLIKVGKKSGEKKTFSLVLWLIIAMLFGVVLYSQSETVAEYVDNIIYRFTATAGSDVDSLMSRQYETKMYIELFNESPLFGGGWHILNNSQFVSELGSTYQAHNMYVAVLAFGGLLFFVPFVIVIMDFIL